MQIIVRHSGEDIPIENLSLSEAVIIRKKSATDEFRAKFTDPAGANSFSTGETIEIYADGIRKFRGRIARLDTTLGGDDDSVSMAAKGPWFDLESIVYQQTWKAARQNSSGAVLLEDCVRSKIVLGQDSQSNKIDAATQLYDIFNYAISKGAEFSIGNIVAAADIPLDEAKDLSCAEAVSRILKWMPDTGVYFDYSAPGFPELSVLPRGNLATQMVDISSGNVKSVKVGPRPDLQVSSVSIKYESEHSDGDNSWLTVTEDNYPPNSEYGGKNAVVMSVELAGYKGSCQIYEIECQSIQLNSPQWWRNRIPALSEAEDLEVLSSEREEGSLKLPRFLASGTIHPSMNFSAARERVDAVVKYTDADGSVVKKNIGVRFVTTNASTGTYAVRSASQYAEPVPSGLAKAIYDASSAPQYEGAVEIFGGDAADFAAAKICLSGGNSEWLSMNSPVYSASENLSDNTLTVKFGPPTHLYPDRIAEMFRIGRPRVVPYSSNAKSGGISASSRVYFSGVNSENDGGQGDTSYLKFVVTQDEQGSIELDSESIKKGNTAKMREIYVTKNARLAKANALMTDPEEVE